MLPILEHRAEAVSYTVEARHSLGDEHRRRSVRLKLIEELVLAWIEAPDDHPAGAACRDDFLLAKFIALELGGYGTRILDNDLEPRIRRYFEPRRRNDTVLHLDFEHGLIRESELRRACQTKRRENDFDPMLHEIASFLAPRKRRESVRLQNT